jgi:hypothetical protein
MVKEVWFNLPVNDLAKSKEFFRAIGFKINPRFENSEDMVSVLVGENNINIMLFPKKTFQSFIQTEITDSKQSNEILISFDAESIAEVDELALKVESAGGKLYSKPQLSQGWLYGFGFLDLDDHRWNVLYMDYSKMK